MPTSDTPFLSKCLLNVFNLICASFYLLLPSISSYISTGMVGALFVLMFPPIMVLVACVKLLDFIVPAMNGLAFYYVGVPVLIIYIVQVLIGDESHLKPLLANIDRLPLTSWLEINAWQFWNTHFKYFPTTIVASDQVILNPEKQYIFAVHPHGIHCWPMMSFASPQSPFDVKFPGLVGKKLCGLAATVIFKIPLIREIFLRMGYVDARKSVAEKVLSDNLSLFICIGGEEEVMLTNPGCDTVVLLKRKGFIKLALSYGCTLVPVFGVGVSDTFLTYDLGTLKFRKWFQKATGIDTPPVPVKGVAVDDALVEEYHAKYVKALMKLYKDNVDEERTLVVV